MVKEKERDKAATRLRELTIPVAGMSCAACVNKVEKALKGLPGVREATVSLAAGKAGVVFDPQVCALPQMERAIEDIGYEVPWSRQGPLVLGVVGRHCEDAIQNAPG